MCQLKQLLWSVKLSITDYNTDKRQASPLLGHTRGLERWQLWRWWCDGEMGPRPRCWLGSAGAGPVAATVSTTMTYEGKILLNSLNNGVADFLGFRHDIDIWYFSVRISKRRSKEGRVCWLLVTNEARTVATTNVSAVRRAARSTTASTSSPRRSSSVRWAVNKPGLGWPPGPRSGNIVTQWHRYAAVARVCAAADRASCSVSLPRLATCHHCTVGLDGGFF